MDYGLGCSGGGVEVCAYDMGSNSWVVIVCICGWLVVIGYGGVHLTCVAVAVWRWFMNVVGVIMILVWWRWSM